MIDLCVLGDSHIGSIKYGWEKAGEVANGFDPTYFGVFGRYAWGGLRLEGDRLVPTSKLVAEGFARTSGGLGEIDVRRYDAFLIVGMGLSALRTSTLYRTHRLSAHVRNGEAPISRSCLVEATDNLVRISPSCQAAGWIRSRTSAPILVLPAPYPNATIAEAARWQGIWDDDMIRRFLVEQFCQALERVGAELGVLTAPQPAATVLKHMTPQQFSHGGVRRGEREDYVHMNAAFGGHVVGNALGILTALPVRKRVPQPPAPAQAGPPAKRAPVAARGPRKPLVRRLIAACRPQRLRALAGRLSRSLARRLRGTSAPSKPQWPGQRSGGAAAKKPGPGAKKRGGPGAKKRSGPGAKRRGAPGAGKKRGGAAAEKRKP